MLIIPTPTNGTPNTRMRVALSGATYEVQWRWNARDSAWYFGMWDPSGEPLVSGVRVVLNVDLLAGVAPSDRRPPHPIVVVDPSGGTTEPTRETLGATIQVVYAEPAA